MAQLVQKTSFAGGEIDPMLLERQNIQRVATGLETDRNMLVGKNALQERRPGTKFHKLAKANSGNVKTFKIPYTDYMMEVTENNIRLHTMGPGTYSDIGTGAGFTCADANIESLSFVYSSSFLNEISGDWFVENTPVVYIFGLSTIYVLKISTLTVYAAKFQQIRYQYLQSGNATATKSSAFAGAYDVDYCVTVVTPNGEETVIAAYLTFDGALSQLQLPDSTGEYNQITIQTQTSAPPYATTAPLEYRVYRRPKNAGAFGYIGSAFEMTSIANGFQSLFKDVGQVADYSKNPPTYIIPVTTGVPSVVGTKGLIYQGRLLIGNTTTNSEYIFASRPRFPWNFTRDYPLSDDSALLFKSGQSNAANVLAMADMGTLVVFTSVGVYTQLTRGALTPSNAALTFVNGSVIDPNVPPVKLGDLLVFYDGSVKSIDFSNQRQNYTVEDLTDFSAHLFRDKTVTSWATIKKFNTDILFAVLDDGSVVSFVNNPKQELQAWTRHDFLNGSAISVCGDIANDELIFVVERDGVRTIEYLGDEYMDAYVTKSLNMAAQLGTTVEALDWFFTALGPDGFAGPIRLDTNTPGSNFESAFSVGKIYRLFDSNGDAYDLECTQIVGVEQVKFEIYNESFDELPVELRTNPDIWETFTDVTGLTHLNGKEVAVTVDGTPVSSPLNNNLNMTDLTPTLGTLTIPRAAFAAVGLPFASDIGTTDVKSTQDAKVGLSTRIAGKVYTKTDDDSQHFYVGASLPEDDTVTNMQRATEMFQNQNNRNPKIRVYESIVPADWNNGGRVCIRVVDPVPFRLLSITTAVTIS